MRVFCEEKLKKLPGNRKIRAFFYGIFVMDISFFVLFVIVVKKFSEKKFGQTAKIIIFVCILDHN
jgi:hypothetical protein